MVGVLELDGWCVVVVVAVAVVVVCAANDVDVLASVDTEGNELLWQVSLDGSSWEMLCNLRELSAPPASPTSRLLWHPNVLGLLATVNGDSVRVMDVQSIVYVPIWAKEGPECLVLTLPCVACLADSTAPGTSTRPR